MKKILAILLTMLMLFAFTGTTVMADEKSDDIVVLYTNDVHTYIDGTISYDVIAAIKKVLKTQYYIDDTIQMATLPFEDGFEMVFVLPRYKKSIEDAIDHLATQYKNCTDNMETYEIALFLPKFKTEFSIYMRDILYAMGMERAFGCEAQFGNISGTQLYIDNIIQKTYIGVDEDGAEAAAVTAVTMRCGALPPQDVKRATMMLDRPFIYAIRDRVTDTMIFVGTVGNPNKK